MLTALSFPSNSALRFFSAVTSVAFSDANEQASQYVGLARTEKGYIALTDAYEFVSSSDGGIRSSPA